MIRILIIFLIFSLLPAAAAEDTRPGEKSTGNDEQNQPLEKKEEESRQNPTPWPLPFAPSQDIGADSQVAFPTDI